MMPLDKSLTLGIVSKLPLLSLIEILDKSLTLGIVSKLPLLSLIEIFSHCFLWV